VSVCYDLVTSDIEDERIMTVQTLKLGRREYVLISKKDFARLQRRAGELTEQDLGDIAESKRRLAEPGRSIPLSDVRKRLGL
jgi:hypothetical protein